jgi:hypothetical protein
VRRISLQRVTFAATRCILSQQAARRRNTSRLAATRRDVMASQARRALCRVLEFCVHVTAAGESFSTDTENVRRLGMLSLRRFGRAPMRCHKV